MMRQFMTWSMVCAALFFIVTDTIHATELSSTNYTLTTGGVGKTEGSILSSTNYTIIPQNNETYGGTGGDGVPPKRGSRATHVDTFISSSTLPEVIVGTYRENIAPQGSGVGTFRDDAEGDSYVGENDEALEMLSEVNVRGKEILNMHQTAALIGAWLDELSADFEEVFAERTPRIVVLIFALIVLFFIRTYTVLGRKYRPF